MKVLIEKIKQTVGSKKAAALVFGDAESMATASLLLKSLNAEDVYFIHIDHGMLRKDESITICDTLRNLGAKNIVNVDASAEFLTATANVGGKIIGPLSSTYDPTAKRNLIEFTLNKILIRTLKSLGEEFVLFKVHEFGDVSLNLDNETVKKLIEGKNLSEMLVRQPFPVPAFAVRIICNDAVVAITTEQRDKLTSMVSSYQSGYFCRIAPLRTVGICDGKRTYKSMAVLFANALDSYFPEIFALSQKIHKALPYLCRTILRIDSASRTESCHDKPLSINRDTVHALRIADSIVTKALSPSLATQFFCALVPYVTDKSKSYSVIIRAVITDDFKEARAALVGRDISKEMLEEAANGIKKALGDSVDMIFYDVTSKPPAAIEFE